MEEIRRLQEELEHWKKLCDDANQQKKLKCIQKINLDDEQEELQKELDALIAKKKNVQGFLKDQESQFKDEMLDLGERYKELKEEQAELQRELNESHRAFMRIQENLLNDNTTCHLAASVKQWFQDMDVKHLPWPASKPYILGSAFTRIDSQLPQKNLNFKCSASEENETNDEPMDIMYTCQIVSGRPNILGDGQALLTFEEEQVAKAVIAKKRHLLENDGTRVSVEAAEPILGKAVKLEVNMSISSKKMKVCNLPKEIPEEVLKDKLELHFYKSDVGGGEIEEVDYDRDSNTAFVTYLQNGVIQRVLKNKRYGFRAGGVSCEIDVKPCVDIELNKLQMFSAISSRTVLLTGIKNFDDLEEDDVQDVLEIHFQKQSNGGGEVEKTLFCKDRRVNPIFEDDLK